jgi:hypothetical protein
MGSGGTAPRILSLGSRPLCFSTVGKVSRCPLFRRLDGPQIGLNAVTERKNPCPSRESDSGRPARAIITIQVFIHTKARITWIILVKTFPLEWYF